MNLSDAKLSTDERRQFIEAFEENLDLVLELLEAVRCESANIDDNTAAEFLHCMSQIIRMFRRAHRPGGHHDVLETKGRVRSPRWADTPGEVSQYETNSGR